jgi:hypothetical protein
MSNVHEKAIGQQPVTQPSDRDIEINEKVSEPMAQSFDGEKSDEELDNNAQEGVRRAEAITQAWSKSHLYTAYIM